MRVMSSVQAWSVALIGAGAAIQLLGVVLAAVEIVHRGRLLRQFRVSERVLHTRVAPPPATAHAAAPGAAVSPTGTPTIEDRLSSLEAELSRIPERISAAATQAETNAKAHADDRAHEVGEDQARDVSRLRDLLVGSVDGNRRAIIGVCALSVGLVLQAAGSVVSSLL